MRRNLWTALALGALLAPATAHGQTSSSDWSDNASARLDSTNLSRAMLVEQLENGFYQNPPDYHNDYNWYDQRAIGNMTMTDVQVSESCSTEGMENCTVTVHTNQDANQSNQQSDQQANIGDGGQTNQTVGGDGVNQENNGGS